MITNITLANFKCFRQVSIDPKLITVLIGRNGTGKSGIFQSLLLLKQSANADKELTFDGPWVQLDPADFVNRSGGAAINSVRFSIAGLGQVDSAAATTQVQFNVNLQYTKDGVATDGKTGGTTFSFEGRDYEVTVPSPSTTRRLIHERRETVYEPGKGLNIVSLIIYPVVDDPTDPILRAIFGVPASVMRGIHWVPAVRGMAGASQPLGDEPARYISSAEGLGKQEADTLTNLAYNRPLEPMISTWMKRVTGVGFKTAMVPGRSVKAFSETDHGDVSIGFEGSGSNSLVRLLFELGTTGHGETILIEEPEISLHPRAQAELASVFVEEAKANEKQVIMATHSEHLAARILIEIAEGNLSVDDVAIYSFDKDTDGICTTSPIEITERGQVVGGLKGFFDTNLEEMDRYVKALQTNS